MERLIDADALAKELLSITYLGCDGGYYKGRADERDDTLQRIKNAPTIDPVKRGEWAHVGGDEWCCTACGDVITTEGSWEKPTSNYCRNCGADMRNTKEDEKI